MTTPSDVLQGFALLMEAEVDMLDRADRPMLA